MKRSVDFLYRNMAEAALCGPWNAGDIARSWREAIRGKARWIRPLARRLVASHSEALEVDELTGFLRREGTHLQDAIQKGTVEVGRVFSRQTTMADDHGWDVPPIQNASELAHFFAVSPRELDWYADRGSWNRFAYKEQLRHYHYRFVPKRDGTSRLIEIPKDRLKIIQRKLLHSILGCIPVHPRAHGFQRGRSIRSYASPHAGQRVVWRLDLKDFFPSISSARVRGIFRSAGYPPKVAELLAGLCLTWTPDSIGGGPGASYDKILYGRPHLPQGAPTSPALANLAAFQLDVRLASWAAACDATYTRYADDLAFSGGQRMERSGLHFREAVYRIVVDEGFRVNGPKSRWMTASRRQHLAGVVVNEFPNFRRDRWDRLKAVLTNCVRTGPEPQNRGKVRDFRAYLLGQIAHVTMLNADRGWKLRAIFDRISWK